MINAKKMKNKPTSKIAVGSLYDLNKDLVQKQTKPLTEEELAEKKTMVLDFLNKKRGSYFMLLCHEQRDYTVFSLSYSGGIANATNILLDECLPNRGIIHSIDITKDENAIEIWLIINGTAYCYYFFKYDDAVIEC